MLCHQAIVSAAAVLICSAWATGATSGCCEGYTLKACSGASEFDSLLSCYALFERSYTIQLLRMRHVEYRTLSLQPCVAKPFFCSKLNKRSLQ